MSRKTILNQLEAIIAKGKEHWFDLHRPDGTFIKGSGTPIGILRIANKIIYSEENIIKAYVDKRLISEIKLDTIKDVD